MPGLVIRQKDFQFHDDTELFAHIELRRWQGLFVI